MTAGGGLGGGQAYNQGGAGGVAAITGVNSTRLSTEYGFKTEPLNGNRGKDADGNWQIGTGGAAVSHRGFSGAAGGKGGYSGSNANGKAGGAGSVVIRYCYFDVE
jgi:hypothetical protein